MANPPQLSLKELHLFCLCFRIFVARHGALRYNPYKWRHFLLAWLKTDEHFQQELEKQLILLQRQEVINTWHSSKITLDTNAEQPIDSHLREADLILLLISPDLVASHYWYNIEMEQIMKQYKKGESRVIPIIIRAVDWSSLPFRWLQPLPSDGRSVAERSKRDQAFQEIAKGIKEIIDKWFSSRTIEEWIDKGAEQP